MHGWEWYTPYKSEDPNPTIPTYRQKEKKGKRVTAAAVHRCSADWLQSAAPLSDVEHASDSLSSPSSLCSTPSPSISTEGKREYVAELVKYYDFVAVQETCLFPWDLLKTFIQIKNIWYYNVYIHKLKLSIKYFNLNITVTSHAEKVSIFTRQIFDTRLSLLW